MVLSKERTRRAWQPGERAVVVRDQCDLGEGVRSCETVGVRGRL